MTIITTTIIIIIGVVYRPITNTYAAGALSEQYTDSHLDISHATASTDESGTTVLLAEKGFLTSNGGISPFIR